MSKKKGKEISVADVADFLKVTERTVINLIRSKQLKAAKVGKRWFVDELSVRNLSAGAELDVKVSERELEPVVLELSEKRRPRSGLQGLSCYKIACEIFSAPSWKRVSEDALSETFPLISGVLLASQVAILQMRIIEALGAGYHLFGNAKVAHYGHARAATGSLLALLSAHPKTATLLESECNALEAKLLPALVALQRTAEQRTHSRRAPP